MMLIKYDRRPTDYEISDFVGDYDGIGAEGKNWLLARNLDGENLTYRYQSNIGRFNFVSLGIKI